WNVSPPVSVSPQSRIPFCKWSSCAHDDRLAGSQRLHLRERMRFLVTGSSGLIGSEAVRYFASRGHRVFGIDNNLRRFFFGPDGDTTWGLERLKAEVPDFVHRHEDIRDRAAVLSAV